MIGRHVRRSPLALLAGVTAALAGAAGLMFASASTLTVTPKPASAFRTCILSGYPTTSTVVADTWADENAKTSNKAGGTIVQVTSRSGQNKRAFLRFDLTKCAPVLASTVSVERATLRLYLSLRPASTRTYNVQRVVTPCPQSATTCWTKGGSPGTTNRRCRARSARTSA